MGRSIAVTLVLLAAGFIGIQHASAQADTVAMSATVNGHNIVAATGSQPLRLDPGGPVDIVVAVTNHSGQAVDIRQVEFAGHVLGLNFFTYATSVDLTVQPGKTDALRYRLDLTGLRGRRRASSALI